jgi:hypothetical protein
MHFQEVIILLVVLAAAAAVSFTCAVGLVVWLAGGKVDPIKDRRHA